MPSKERTVKNRLNAMCRGYPICPSIPPQAQGVLLKEVKRMIKYRLKKSIRKYAVISPVK